MKAWADTAASIWASMKAYEATKSKVLTRIRVSVSALGRLINDGNPYIMYDADWLALDRALLVYGLTLVRLPTGREVAILEIDKAKSWVKLKLFDTDKDGDDED